MNDEPPNATDEGIILFDIGSLIREMEQSRPNIRPLTQDERDALTWDALVEREPRLAALLEDCRNVEDAGGPVFCANAAWYNKFRRRLIYLVGWELEAWSTDPVMTSSAAYDIAYRTCYEALPGCRNCWCFNENEFDEAS